MRAMFEEVIIETRKRVESHVMELERRIGLQLEKAITLERELKEEEKEGREDQVKEAEEQAARTKERIQKLLDARWKDAHINEIITKEVRSEFLDLKSE